MSTRKSRRDFNKTVALLAAGAVGATAADAGPAQEKPLTLPTTSQALMDIVRSRYGKHLNEEQLKRVRQKILAGLRSADQLRKVPLKNSDEPAFLFQADVT